MRERWKHHRLPWNQSETVFSTPVPGGPLPARRLWHLAPRLFQSCVVQRDLWTGSRCSLSTNWTGEETIFSTNWTGLGRPDSTNWTGDSPQTGRVGHRLRRAFQGHSTNWTGEEHPAFPQTGRVKMTLSPQTGRVEAILSPQTGRVGSSGTD